MGNNETQTSVDKGGKERVALSCPLCDTGQAPLFHQDKRRVYHRCCCCGLVFVPERFWLSAEKEHKHYSWHENNPTDLRYRKFLSRLCTPLLAYLEEGDRGLDFGSGPGPTLSVMLEEAGFEMAIYDLFFADDPAVFEQRYAFVTATEVFEHLFRPKQEIERLLSILNPRGVLGIMTKLVLNQEKFATWHYKNDPTHVIFFSQQTLEWLAQAYCLTLTNVAADAFILQKIA